MEKKGTIPGGVFGNHQVVTTGYVELTGRLLGVIAVMCEQLTGQKARFWSRSRGLMDIGWLH